MIEDQMINDVRSAITNLDFVSVSEMIQKSLEMKIPASRIVIEALEPGMMSIGKKFDEGSVFLPTIIAASDMMSEALESLSPSFNITSDSKKEVIVMGTVQGDIHEMGKNICIAMLRSAGYRVIDLGCDVHPERFVEATEDNCASILALSAPMSTTMYIQKETIKLVKEDNLHVKVIIGGAPCTKEWCKSINADGYSANWKEFVELVKEILR